jgi:hypothetical protein
VEHLERHGAIVAEVAGEIDRGHAAATKLALDAVLVTERVLKPLAELGLGLMRPRTADGLYVPWLLWCRRGNDRRLKEALSSHVGGQQ